MNDIAASLDGLPSKVYNGELTWRWPLIMLVTRGLLFAGWQTVIAAALAWRGVENSWQASIAWWPWTGILTSLMILVLLAWLFHNEGSSLVELYRFDRTHLKSDLLVMLGFFVLAGPVGYLPNLIFGNLLFGRAEAASALMFLPLPYWAAVFAVILFPLTVALTELPTYFGYSMPRIEALSGKAWLAVLLPSFFLAAQHMALPLIFDPRFLAYRLLMFLPFALLVGLLLHWRPRLMPYMIIVHFLIDIPTIYFVLTASL